MSSGVEAEGIIAAAVILPAAAAAAAFGAGWLAWQAGKLIIEAGKAVDREVAESKRLKEEAARHRRMAAIAAHNQLVDMCGQILQKLDQNSAGSIEGFAELEQIKYDLKKICEEALPDDTAQIESLTSLGYLKLDKAIQQQKQIAAFELSESASGLYRGLSVADLMDDLRIAIAAMEIYATVGKDVKAADPAVLERAKLNERFTEVTGKIMAALEAVDSLTTTCGLTDAGSAWFHSCFNGVDILIETLCRPTTSNQELKKGIHRLEDAVRQYEMMAPSIEREIRKMIALYEVYVNASTALGEKVESIKSFKKSDEIEARLKELQVRAEQAKKCSEIYQKLGPEAYLCYAWDQELQAMGYKVHTREHISEMAQEDPEHAKLGEKKLPFYRWNEDDLTQLYSVSEECALQVIIHEDGTVSMQTIAESNSEDVVAAQHKHCDQLKMIHERLRKNWFVLYDYEETETADRITTVSSWRAADDQAFGRKSTDEGTITDRRGKGKGTPAAKQAK